MSGENNATTIILMKGAVPAAIVGQGEFTVTYGGEPIDISNKSFADFVTLLDANLSTKQVVITGTLTYNDDTVYRAVRAEALTGTQDDYALTFPDSAKIEAKFVPHAMSDALPHGAATMTSITFSSSGEVTHTAAT